MREILFRGKRFNDEENEWAYGSYVKQYECDMIYFPTAESDGFDYAHIIPETVGQYTGLTDKNGKKIFEGDIVKYEKYATEISNNVYVVKYDTELATFIGEKYSQIHVTSFTTFENDSEFIEVIGNIHDNSELLKGGADNGK